MRRAMMANQKFDLFGEPKLEFKKSFQSEFDSAGGERIADADFWREISSQHDCRGLGPGKWHASDK